MFKKLLAATFAALVATSYAAVDINKADQAQLETVKGIGPSMSSRVLDERKKGEFKDWTDLQSRVKGVGDKKAAAFSADGLTVNGATYGGAAADKGATKADAAVKPAKK